MPPRSRAMPARLEDRLTDTVGAAMARRGWKPQVVPYIGYGTPEWVRVFGRALLARPNPRDPAGRRGWRAFFTAPLRNRTVELRVGGREVELRTDRQGYVDAQIAAENEPGWQDITFEVADGPVTTGKVRIVDPDATRGLISDIDDTTLVTSLPRPMLAAWNTFVVHEQARAPVPGMPEFYRDWLAGAADVPVFYVSTGAWNTHATLVRFFSRHGYPDGPLLMTDWGPTNTGWFRSGADHKRRQLRRLREEFPHIRWLLVGDDGQRDPMIYTEFAAEFPDFVEAIALRELSPAQQVLAHGSPAPSPAARTGEVPVSRPIVRGRDGTELARRVAGLA